MWFRSLSRAAIVAVLMPIAGAWTPAGEWHQVRVEATPAGMESLAVRGLRPLGKQGGELGALIPPDRSIPTGAREISAGEKLDARIRGALEDSPSRVVEARIGFLAGVPFSEEALLARLREAGVELQSSRLHAGDSVPVLGSPDALAAVAADPLVRVVASRLPLELWNKKASDAINVDTLWPGGESGLELSGAGRVGGLGDGGGVAVGHARALGVALEWFWAWLLWDLLKPGQTCPHMPPTTRR